MNFTEEERKEAQKKIVDHGRRKCPTCGHSGYAHGPRGCSAFREGTPTRYDEKAKMNLVVIPEGRNLEEFYCGCKDESMCLTNIDIINGREEP